MPACVPKYVPDLLYIKFSADSLTSVHPGRSDVLKLPKWQGTQHLRPIVFTSGYLMRKARIVLNPQCRWKYGVSHISIPISYPYQLWYLAWVLPMAKQAKMGIVGTWMTNWLQSAKVTLQIFTHGCRGIAQPLRCSWMYYGWSEDCSSNAVLVLLFWRWVGITRFLDRIFLLAAAEQENRV